RVLHRDDRLCREVLQQCDLLVAERPDLTTVNDKDTEYRLILAQGHPECGTSTCVSDERNARGESRAIGFGIGHIGNVDHVGTAHYALQTAARLRLYRGEPCIIR